MDQPFISDREVDLAIGRLCELFDVPYTMPKISVPDKGPGIRLPYEKIGAFHLKNPFSIWWVFPKDGQPVILKGGDADCRTYVKEHFKVAFCHKLLYEKMIGFSYTRKQAEIVGLPDHMKYTIKFENMNRRLHKGARFNRNRWIIEIKPARLMHFPPPKLTLVLKSLPKSWLQELDIYFRHTRVDE